MNAYTIVGYTYGAALHCLECAMKAHNLDPDGEDDHNTDIYVAGITRANGAPIPYRNAPHAVFDYENDSVPHGQNCDTCGTAVFDVWCEGCAECAPMLRVVAENRDDDPWTATLTVTADSAVALDRWLSHNGGCIGGSSWEQEINFAYASPACYIGCVNEWRKEGYSIDDSMLCDDPIESFLGMSDAELTARFAELQSCLGLEDEDVTRIRATIAAYESFVYSHEDSADYATQRAAHVARALKSL